MSSPQLHALLVGINKYENFHHNFWLGSCHTDSDRLEEYLRDPIVASRFAEVNIRSMKEGVEEASNIPTKENLISAFRNHLGKAKPGDTAVFFFAGHGVRESTGITSFSREELDGMIGGLAMHDVDLKDKTKIGSRIVADKEVRYLIKELSDKGTQEEPIHIVVIFDCCHSGESTRSVAPSSSGEEEMPIRSRQLLRTAIGNRELDDLFFIGEGDIRAQLEEEKPLDQILPQGDHIMLAACREIELAWEGPNGGGAFTAGLVDVLRKHDGDITYQELHNRVMNRMRFIKLTADSDRDYRQTPQFYINTRKLSDRYRNFLTNTQKEQPNYGALEFNSAENQYRLDIGALHGVPVNPETGNSTKVLIYPVGDEANPKTAQVESVFPTHCVLNLFGFEPDLDNSSWRGKLQGIALPKIKFAITGEAEGVSLATPIIEKKISETANSSLELVALNEGPEYLLVAENGNLQIKEGGNNPLAKLVATPYKSTTLTSSDTTGADSVEIQYGFLQQISQWHRLRDLEHNGEFTPPDPRFDHPQYPVELNIWEYDPQTQTESLVPQKSRAFNIELTPEKKERRIRFELINRSDKSLFVSLTWMTHTFGFFTHGDYVLMHKAQLELGPMTEPSMGIGENHVQHSRFGDKMPNGKTYMLFASGGYVEKYNWKGMQDYLKLLVSEIPFDIEAMHMDYLPGPDEELTKSRFMAARSTAKAPIPKWELSTFSMFITNPVYQPPVMA